MTSTSRVSDSREAFEEWAAEEHGAWLHKDSHGRYTIPAEESMWLGWQAALSTMGDVVPVRRDVYEFLMGIGPLNGLHFGESSEIGRPYWWRHDLSAILNRGGK
ncbi:hypothetical protein [Luteibacter sp. E-22]|uniref:hypothetical protein n=1 Tax=Luteibacter sp. E-22 TaxID=3404050 RepID=UPI003CFB9C9C